MVKRDIKKNLAEALEIPDEVALDSARIVLTGNRRIQVENHKGIIEYLPEKIVFRTAQGQVEVYGQALSLATLCAESLSIEGKILALSLKGENTADGPR